MMVCERIAHSWSVLCPSFFSFYIARASPLHIHSPPTSRMLLFVFFQPACARAFVFSVFFFSLLSRNWVFVQALRLVFYATRPYGRTRRREKFAIFVAYGARKNAMGREKTEYLHNYIFRSSPVMSEKKRSDKELRRRERKRARREKHRWDSRTRIVKRDRWANKLCNMSEI